MRRLKKTLYFVMGAITFILCCVAFCTYYAKLSMPMNIFTFTYKQQTLPWGENLETQARKSGRLIFFITSEKFPKNSQISKLLSSKYVISKMDKRRWPADFAIFSDILEITVKNKGGPTFGVLLPNLHPIVLSAENFSEQDLLKFLKGAVAAYDEYSETIQHNIDLAVDEFYDDEKLFFLKSSNPYFGQDFGDSLEIESLEAFFENENNFKEPAAVISETARLAAAIARRSPENKKAKNLAELASEMLLDRIFSEDFSKERASAKRLVMLRAFADVSAFLNEKNLNSRVEQFADEILLLQSARGLFSDEGKAPSVLENAFALAFLTESYKCTKNEKYLKAASECADALNFLFDSRREFSEVLDSENSLSSALSYAALSNALTGLYFETKNETLVKDAKKCLEILDKYFLTHSGLWSVNSKNSPLADFVRPVFIEDKLMPSYFAEAVQSIYALQSINPTDPFLLKFEHAIATARAVGAHSSNKPFSFSSMKLANLKALRK